MVGVFVPSLIFNQTLIVYMKMSSIDWLKMCLGQIVLYCFQRDIHFEERKPVLYDMASQTLIYFRTDGVGLS